MTTKFYRGIHELCRPPATARNVEKLTTDGWVNDDGTPGWAFSGEDEKGYPWAWSTTCCEACFGGDKCPRGVARNRTSARFGCSNGKDVPPSKTKSKKR